MLDSNLKRLTLWLLPVVCMIGLSMPVMAVGTNALDSSVAQPTFDAPVALSPGPPILFFMDLEVGDGVFDDALANLGLSGDVTFTADAATFGDMLDDQDWACVIALNQNFPATASFAAALTTHVGGGGHAIFTDWSLSFSGQAALYNAFEVAGTGSENMQPITTDGNPLWAGLPAAVGLSNPGWLTWSMGLATVGGGVGTGTFPNGDAAVVMGNGGATAFNGPLSDTFTNQAEGILFAENEINEICFPPDFSKSIVDGPDADSDDVPDVVVPVKDSASTEYVWMINWYQPDGADVLIADTAPAEWVVNNINGHTTHLPLGCGDDTAFSDPAGDTDVYRGGKSGKKCHSSTHLEWTPASNDEMLFVGVGTRQSPGKGHTKKGGDPAFAPTSCGALYLNNGAVAFELDENGDIVGSIMETNALCLAAVSRDLYDATVDYSADGDHDVDGLSSWLEACDGVTDPCNPDTDGDGILDGVDDCPLEGPADPALGEILEADGCIRQSQCSDGVDNDGDGDVDYPADSGCDDLVDDSEGAEACEAFACGDGPCDTETGPDACFCFATDPALSAGICVDNFQCSGGEDCSADAGICAPLGKVCFYATCCGAPLCGPAQCTGVIQSAHDMSLDPGPTAAGL